MNRQSFIIAAVVVLATGASARAFVSGTANQKWGAAEFGVGATVTYSFGTGEQIVSESGTQLQSVPISTIFPAGYELEVERGMIIWAAYGDLDFLRQQDGLYGDAVDIGIAAHPRPDGTNYLAHASLPPAGDLHFASNLNNGWSYIESDPGAHILTTAVHEFGHSLGLFHAGAEKQGVSIMQGGGLFDDGNHETIWQDDIDAMHFIYGPAAGATWDPLFLNAPGSWNDAARWFTNAEPDAATSVSVFNGNLAVTAPGEEAASLRLGGMSAGLVRVLGAGELQIAGATMIRHGGTLAMLGGAASTGSLDLSAGGALAQRISDSPVATLAVTDTAIVAGGTLALSPAGGFTPASGEVFPVLTAGSVVGEFAAVEFAGLDPALAVNVDYLSNGVEAFIYLPGDFDADGVLGTSDWLALRGNLFTDVSSLGQAAAYAAGDFTFNGIVDHEDFMGFKSLYVAEFGAAAWAALAAIPEPSAMLLSVLAAAAVSSHVRRRSA
ncbi:MAG: hypothetical protein CMJ58_23565 [Planctomycetaceae bacterium]|nr:hypothetical protein [Planctomycetaceae bacterium]